MTTLMRENFISTAIYTVMCTRVQHFPLKLFIIIYGKHFGVKCFSTFVKKKIINKQFFIKKKVSTSSQTRYIYSGTITRHTHSQHQNQKKLNMRSFRNKNPFICKSHTRRRVIIARTPYIIIPLSSCRYIKRTWDSARERPLVFPPAKKHFPQHI